jgi:hypothetical protein
MFSALVMFRQVARALRHAIREEDFLPVLTAGAVLVTSGTVAYTLGENWHVIDALYFAVATLTTTSVADPDLVLEDHWMKLFTILYQLAGIGILVEILRRVGLSFLAVRAEERQARPAVGE